MHQTHTSTYQHLKALSCQESGLANFCNFNHQTFFLFILLAIITVAFCVTSRAQRTINLTLYHFMLLTVLPCMLFTTTIWFIGQLRAQTQGSRIRFLMFVTTLILDLHNSSKHFRNLPSCLSMLDRDWMKEGKLDNAASDCSQICYSHSLYFTVQKVHVCNWRQHKTTQDNTRCMCVTTCKHGKNKVQGIH